VKANSDLFRFLVGVATIWIWLPALILGGVVAVFVMAGGHMIQVVKTARQEMADWFSGKAWVAEHMARNAEMYRDAASGSEKLE
jgi:hypothetical protein